MYLKNREDGYGGVAIVMKNRIISNLITLPQFNCIEIIGVKAEIKNNIYNIINIYINPRSNNESIICELDILTRITASMINVIICGDVNTAHPIWDNNCLTSNNRADAIFEFLTENSLTTLNDGQPTHLNHSNSRAIDITAISTNIFDQFTWKIQDDNCNSDHFLIFIKKIDAQENNKTKLITNYRNAINELNNLEGNTVDSISSMPALNNLIETIIFNNTREIKLNF